MDTTARSAAAAALARARAASLSPERRSEIARQAVVERWRKYRERQKLEPDPEPDPTGTDPAPSKVASLADAARARGRKLSPPTPAVTAREAGRKGGQARAARLTPEERSEAARAAVLARWERFRLSSSGRWVVALARLRSAANDAATYTRAA